MWLYHHGSCLSFQRCSCILCIRVHVLFFFFNKMSMCYASCFLPTTCTSFCVSISRCRSSF